MCHWSGLHHQVPIHQQRYGWGLNRGMLKEVVGCNMLCCGGDLEGMSREVQFNKLNPVRWKKASRMAVAALAFSKILLLHFTQIVRSWYQARFWLDEVGFCLFSWFHFMGVIVGRSP